MTPLEIERVFLLSGMPAIPTGSKRWRIEQGYLPLDAAATLGIEGRLRRIGHEDGRVEFIHTVKTGAGRVRTEVERPIDEAEFARHWPATAGMRLAKTRWRVPVGDLTWEIDDFDELDLVLAEVELPSPDHPVVPPAWLAPLIEREVTDEPEYRNAQLALRLAASRHPPSPTPES